SRSSSRATGRWPATWRCTTSPESGKPVAGRTLIVEVAADISQYVKGLSQASTATKKLDVQVSELNVDTKKLTETAVRASVKRAERLEKEVAGYRQLAAAAVKGSREQIAATNLAAPSPPKPPRSFAV